MKKILALAVSIIMMVTLSLPVFAEDPISKTEYIPKDAKVYIKSVQKNLLVSGGSEKIKLTLSTRATGYADDVMVTVSGEGDYANKFSIDDSLGRKEIDYIIEPTEIELNIAVDSSVPNGSYKLKFDFSYSDSGTPFTSTDYCTVAVNGASESVPYIESANFTKKEIDKDNKSPLDVKVINPTENCMYNVKVSFNPSEGFSLYDNYKPYEISSIDSKSNGTAKFSVYVGTAVATGNYPISFNITYSDAYNKTHVITQTVYVQVKRAAGAGTEQTTSQPRIILSKYSTDVQEIKAGKTFLLDFALQNTSTQIVKNIKVVLGSATTPSTQGQSSSSGEVFFAAEGSNSFFIESIGSKKSVSNQIKLMTRQDVEPGVYPIILKVDYEDANGKSYSSDEQVSFAVTQEQRLDIQGLNIPTESMAGMPLNVNFQYINKGKSTIYNFSISVEGDFTIEGGSTYVGNLQAGYNDYFDTMLNPTGEGELKGAIVFKYENSQGQEVTDRHEFTTNIMPADVNAGGEIDNGMNPPIDGMKPVKKGVSPIIWWTVGGVVVVALTVTTLLIIRKKRKAKKGLVNNEED